jgi:hypothetical protein
MTSPRYLNAVLTIIAALLAVIASQTLPVARAAGTQPVSTTGSIGQSSSGRVVFPIGNEGQVTRLIVWDEGTSTVYEYDTGGKLRHTWSLKAPGERLERR